LADCRLNSSITLGVTLHQSSRKDPRCIENENTFGSPPRFASVLSNFVRSLPTSQPLLPLWLSIPFPISSPSVITHRFTGKE
jgi:hypothetical protein